MQQFCSSCGRPRDPSHRFCPECGAPGDTDTTEEVPGGPAHPAPPKVPVRGREIDGPELTAVVIGALIGLLISGAIVWFFVSSGDSDEVAATGVEASGDDADQPQATLSIGPESEQALDDGADGPSTTSTDDTEADDTEADDTEADDTEAAVPGSDSNQSTSESADTPSCPQTAGVDRRRSRSDSVVVEEWRGGDLVVLLCESADGTLSYFGSSDRGTIYLDAERTSDGFTAVNRDTSYTVTDGLLSVRYPAETLTFELRRTS